MLFQGVDYYFSVLRYLAGVPCACSVPQSHKKGPYPGSGSHLLLPCQVLHKSGYRSNTNQSVTAMGKTAIKSSAFLNTLIGWIFWHRVSCSA